ncbi:hypothetical protein BS78_03G021800 [Paspalum vaginatum]|nr:hypothetical protein BS78_03G021800 [Paspalum vaginatum]
MSAQTNDKCPICLEKMDLTDQQLKPCKCGYEMCLWCWHRIMDESGGRCPGCRSVYNKDMILGTSARNQILMELCADKSNYQKEKAKSRKQTSAKVQSGHAEIKDPNSVRVIQRKLVYIVGMPTEFAREKLLRQKELLGQYGKIESIIIDNIGANQQIPDSGRVYVTFTREEEAIRCIRVVDGYSLDGRPLKATFGVTRYCHIWLSNKECYKTNCSYVHYKASAEDICTKDDVSVVCARLQQLIGKDNKCLQHRSGRTLPPPGDCSPSCFGISKDVCISGERLLPNGANKNTALLPTTTPRVSSLSSGSPSSITNAVLDQQNDKSIHNIQQNLSDPKIQKYISPGVRNRSSETTTSVKHTQQSCSPNEGTLLQSSLNTNLVPQGPKEHLSEQLVSINDKSQASSQLGNDTSNSKQTTLAKNGAADTSQQKQQYASVVSQGHVAQARRFTVLSRPLMTSADTRSKATGQAGNGTASSADTRSKATGQAGNGTASSTEHASVKNEHSNCSTVPTSQVSQSREQPLQLLASASVKSYSGAEKKNECSDTHGRLVPGNHKQFAERIASLRSTVVQSISGRPVPSTLSTSDAKSQASVGQHKVSDLNLKLSSQNQSQFVNGQHAPVSNTGTATANICHSTLSNQVPLTDGKRQNPAQGGHEGFYNKEIILPSDLVSSHCSESSLLSGPIGGVSSTDVAAPDRKERKRQACPPGFEKPHVSLSSPADTPFQDSCGITGQQDLTVWATDCLKDDGDVTQNLDMCGVTQNLDMCGSSRFSSTDASRRQHARFAGTFFSGWPNHPHFSYHPSGTLDVHNKPSSYRDGTTGSYMPTGGYGAFCQGTTSDMRDGMGAAPCQQPRMAGPRDGWTYGNTGSGMKCPQVDISYPMYTLF